MGFKNDFLWGTATASYQIEGAAHEGGRGKSVWDIYCEEGRARDGATGDVACDHYHRWREDVGILSDLGGNAYRFSISWSRIIPEGTGRVNPEGIKFYSDLIDALLEKGITPFITLYHWDLPYALAIRGGWRNPESPAWFEEYTRLVAKSFGDRVKNFFTFNEPQCFIGYGYRFGYQAPGLCLSDIETLPMAHNVLKAHGRAVSALKEIIPDCRVGFAPTGTPSLPATEKPEDIEAARSRYFSIEPNNWSWSVVFWSDPVLLGHYPEDDPEFKKIAHNLPADYEKDLPLISTPTDYYGQNIYQGAVCRKGANGIESVPRPQGASKTGADWAITPEALYWSPKFLYERYKLPIIITENGMSCHDTVSLDGKVHDPNRIDFLHRYLRNLKRAADENIPIDGYMLWSILDNFEWQSGYNERFGIVYVDYSTGERIKKDSFEWYRCVIAQNGANL
ncbi:MAG: GH1 family beta-glucosidase [Firmicutes bacterium]|nr:GH1 family beta-glucosidase [Bacillota bacterium]